VRTLRMSRGRRVGDAIISVLIRAGVVPSSYLLTTRGRRTGLQRTNPVTIVEGEGKRWLVAPYGPVSWVHNARASGRVTLRRRTAKPSTTRFEKSRRKRPGLSSSSTSASADPRDRTFTRARTPQSTNSWPRLTGTRCSNSFRPSKASHRQPQTPHRSRPAPTGRARSSDGHIQ
jgi:deazaflavin-dependent oxidoreductase (nitroreductase family)